MKTALIIILAAALTVALAPSAARAALRRFWQRDFPLSPYDFEPKYAIGGRYVTRQEFNEHDLYRRYRAGEITRKEWSDGAFAAHPEWSTPA